MSESTWRGGRRAVIVSTLITLCFVFAVAEVGLRLSPLESRAFTLNKLMVPGLAGDYFPNQAGRIELQTDNGPHPYRFTTNSQGIRGPEFRVEKPEGSFRILALGDSYTWGDGVDDADVWVRLLEAELKSCGPVEVINAGFVGRDTWGEADYLEEKGLALEPDLVLLGMEAGDAMDLFELYSDWDNRAAMVAASRPGWLVRATAWSRVFRLFFGARIAGLAKARVRPETPDGAWLQLRTSVERMRSLCRASGCRLEALEIAPGPDEAWTTERLDSEVRAAGLELIALPSLVDERGPGPGWWEIPGDGHYTAEGNRVLADVVLLELRRVGALPAPFDQDCGAD